MQREGLQHPLVDAATSRQGEIQSSQKTGDVYWGDGRSRLPTLLDSPVNFWQTLQISFQEMETAMPGFGIGTLTSHCCSLLVDIGKLAAGLW